MSVHQLYPYLRVHDGAAAIDFYVRAFGATERMRLTDPTDGRVGHAELEFAEGVAFMLSDEYPEYGLVGPMSLGGASQSVHLHVDDCDAATARAVAAGATVRRPPADQFYGERSSAVVDPFGHEWLLGSHLEELGADEMQRRWESMSQD